MGAHKGERERRNCGICRTVPHSTILPRLFPQGVKRKSVCKLRNRAWASPWASAAATATAGRAGVRYRCRHPRWPAPSGQPGLETNLRSEDVGENYPYQYPGTSSLRTTASRTWGKRDAMEHTPRTVTPKGRFPSRWHHLEDLS